ncbi:Biotin transporter [Desulfonema magnum]|uniref:Biotin transporter n=2 Tax=Desulfonema magnum TaxID=45655 RepID=A0A975BL61_9BACT|nr:biotin transporter BioY [Desulfonema magnum]QTA87526.1 Biotin transporter [Desulfonema magnum]
MNLSNQLRMTVYASLFAALIAVGSYISVAIGPVPIVLQNLFVMLSALLLGSRWGLASVAVYLLAGACGLPVFAGGAGGIGRFAGPTGGYLISYLPAVYIIGLITEKANGRVLFDIVAMICGVVIVYALGVTWLKIVTGMGFGEALIGGMLPFLLGDVLKIAAAVAIAKALRPVIQTSEAASYAEAEAEA